MSGDPVAHLATLIAAFGPLRGGLAMVWAYYDETVVHDGGARGGVSAPSELVVGGCLASHENWTRFSRAWTRALAQENVGKFHAKDFYRWKRPFDWRDADGQPDFERHNAFADKLANIICRHVDEAAAFTSQVSPKRERTRVSYAHGIVLAFRDGSKRKLFKNDAAYVVLARHPELSRWSILRAFEKFDWNRQLRGCGVFEPDDVPPLQAADFVLHAVNKSATGVESRSHERLRKGFHKRGKIFNVLVATSSKPDPAVLKELSC